MIQQTNPDSKGFFNHAGLMLARDASNYTGVNYQKNILEKTGDVFIWHFAELPHKIKQLLREPRFLTVVFTTFAMTSIQFAFYPRISWEKFKALVKYIKIDPAKVKFATYLALMSAAFGNGLRAYGRFSNDGLMNAWYSRGSS